jgi:hypothetical protein
MKIANFSSVTAAVATATRSDLQIPQVSRIDHVPLVTAICNLHFAIFNFQFFSLIASLLFFLLLTMPATAQTIPDKIVATVTNGSQATPDVITYSDLVWQLALEPDRPFSARPSSEALNEALQKLEDQLLVLQEARKLPVALTPDAQKDFDSAVNDQLKDLISRFGGSIAPLQERMTQVGLTSEQLNQILRDRATSAKYIEFRFKAFAVVSEKEISDRYEQMVAAERGTGKIVPKLDQLRDKIEAQLTQDKISDAIDKFTDELRDQPSTEIIILNPV